MYRLTAPVPFSGPTTSLCGVQLPVRPLERHPTPAIPCSMLTIYAHSHHIRHDPYYPCKISPPTSPRQIQHRILILGINRATRLSSARTKFHIHLRWLFIFPLSVPGKTWSIDIQHKGMYFYLVLEIIRHQDAIENWEKHTTWVIEVCI